ncbi:MAG: hypothetical protein ACE5D8_02525 [Fidelibacterota bacterium]
MQIGRQIDSLQIGIPGLKVYYDDQDLPVSVLFLDNAHTVWQERLYQYDEKGVLASVTYFDKSRQATRKTIYDPEEAWANSFRNFLYQKPDNISFTGSRTDFHFKPDGTLEKITFFTVTGESYGMIRFHYNYLGYLQEEAWYRNPGHIPIRRFVYDFDVQSGAKKLWEYDGQGEEVSYIELDMAPADEIYPYPQPRTGNILDEADLIIKDIRRSGVSPPHPVRIPVTVWDRLQYKSGEMVDIRLVDIAGGYVTFVFPGETEEIHLPLAQVKSVRSRWGEYLYP